MEQTKSYPELDKYMKTELIKLVKQYADIGSKSNPDKYAEAIGCDMENAQYRQSYVPIKPVLNYNASSCCLFARAQLKRLGIIPIDEDYNYLKDLGCISQLCKVLSKYKVNLKSGEIPEPGTIIILNPSVGRSSNHVFIPIDESTCIEGGNDSSLGFGGGTAIATSTRNWIWKNNILYSEKNKQLRSVHSIFDLDKE